MFYDWPKIKKHSNGNVRVIETIFDSMTGFISADFGRRHYDKIDFSGDSYLLNPDYLLWAFKHSNKVHAANYLYLASRRNYAEYEVTGDNILPTKYINIPIDKLKQNSLIDIRDTNIHFLLEK